MIVFVLWDAFQNKFWQFVSNHSSQLNLNILMQLRFRRVKAWGAVRSNIKFKQKRKSALFIPQLKIFSLTLSDYGSLPASPFLWWSSCSRKFYGNQSSQTSCQCSWQDCLIEVFISEWPIMACNSIGHLCPLSDHQVQYVISLLPICQAFLWDDSPDILINCSCYLNNVSRLPSNSFWSNIRHLISSTI